MNTCFRAASRPCAGWPFPFPFFTFGIAGIVLILSLHPQLASFATWRNSSPLSIQIWLSHLTHWSLSHLIWDLLVFLLLATLLEIHSRKLLVVCLSVAPPIIMLAQYLMGEHETYRGLSSIDCALYSTYVTLIFRESKLSIGTWSLLIGINLLKALYEVATKGTIFVSDLPSSVSSTPVAHLTGTVIGCLISALFLKSPNSQQSNNTHR